MPRTLKAAAVFWALCILLAAVEARIGANWLGSLLFFLALPVLVGYLAWIHRDILHWSALHPMLALLVYATAVLITAVLILALGLLSGQYLFSAPEAAPQKVVSR